ncbi:MAG: hypothetical protein ACLFU8_06545 [Anaerolineales bacterium]
MLMAPVNLQEDSERESVLKHFDPVAVLIANYFDWMDVEMVTTYHEADLGYGTLFKLCTIAEMTEKCVDASGCAAAMKALVTDFKAGVGVGELYRRYSR